MSRKKDPAQGGYTSSWIRPSTRLAIYLRDGLGCVYCGQDWSVDGLTLDHVVARARDGGNGPDNLVTCCPTCNARKRASGGTVSALARQLGLSNSWLLRRVRAQREGLTQHHRNRAVALCNAPPPWLLELRALCRNGAQASAEGVADG